MQPQQVDKYIENYVMNQGRVRHLSVEVEIMETRIAQLEKSAIDDASLSCQKYNSMPHGSGMSDSTGQLATKFADGYIPEYVASAIKDLATLNDLLTKAQDAVKYVDAWLECLPDDDKYLIMERSILGKTWGTVIDGFEERTGKLYSESGVRLMHKRAMETVYLIAK